MERAWVFETLAVTVATIDFHDPALVDEPEARERGVRVEIRPIASDDVGSVYVSPSLTLRPAVCRIDLLESAPGAADRMHWHPVMDSGEPGDRVFDAAMTADPLAWLAERLAHADELLEQAGVLHTERHSAEVMAIAGTADEVVASAREGLAWAREPWPAVTRDARGIARS